MSPVLIDRLRATRLDHLVARITDGVNGMAEANHDLLAPHPLTDIGFGLVRRRNDSGCGTPLRWHRRAWDHAAHRSPPVIAEYMSELVPATTRAVKVEALNSCSA